MDSSRASLDMSGLITPNSIVKTVNMIKMRGWRNALAAVLMTAPGISVAVSYQLQLNWNDPECNRFLDIIKESCIKDMTDKELCDAINMPVTEVLLSTHFKELDWTPDPAANVSEVAKNTIVATEPVEKRSQSTKSNATWLQEVMKLNKANQVKVAYSQVRLTHNTFYLTQLSETVCDANYNEHGPLPLFGFFSDPSHLHGLPNPPAVTGALVYFDGHLASFFLFPQWMGGAGLPRNRLAVSLQYEINDKKNGSLISSMKWSCPIVIEK